MRRVIRRMFVVAGAGLGLLVFAGVAGATTLGVTAPPAGASRDTCFSGAVFGQYTQDASTPYLVPAGGGTITQWQTYTVGDTPGSSLTFAVLAPAGSGSFTVVGTDTETLPNPLPVSNVASFTLAQPIQVAAGDTLALYTSSTDICYFYGGSVPGTDTITGVDGTIPLTVGEALSPTGAPGPSPSGYMMNVAVTFTPGPQDAGVQTSAPAALAGQQTVLQSTVSNAGPGTGPITFVDQVPTGLQIKVAIAAGGTCAVSGQTVTCMITGLAAGGTSTVDVVVGTPLKAGRYSNHVTVSVATGIIDPNSANNSASRTLLVGMTQCVVPNLRGTPAGVAKAALRDLGCSTHVVRKHSSVAAGLVIGIRGRPGKYPYRHVVTLIVSSGPKP